MVEATDEEVIAEPAAPPVPEPKANRLPEIPVPPLAVITCIEDLQKVLLDHQKWADAVLDPNVEVAYGRANLKGVDLRGYELAGVNLSGANLSEANLAGVDLEGANLTVANLQGAILACANLRHAKLRRARIDGADLRGADLTGANLTGVDLAKATLKSADDPVPADPALPVDAALAPPPDAPKKPRKRASASASPTNDSLQASPDTELAPLPDTAPQANQNARQASELSESTPQANHAHLVG